MKKYKCLSITIGILIAFSMKITAQIPLDETGIYLTMSDYQKHKLSYVLVEKEDKLLRHEFFGDKNLVITSKGKTNVLNKNSIYGYKINNRDYRLYKKISYRIEDSAGFYIYSYEHPVQQGKRHNLVKEVYFSTAADSEVIPLNIENIKGAFPKNHKFKYLVEQQYKLDINLNGYDYRNKEYKLKELYAESKKSD